MFIYYNTTNSTAKTIIIVPQVTVNLDEKPGPHDPLTKWVDHVACWQMQYRGSLGESLLHVLIICDTIIHTRLSRLLLKHYPMLSQDVVEGEEYLGNYSSLKCFILKL